MGLYNSDEFHAELWDAQRWFWRYIKLWIFTWFCAGWIVVTGRPTKFFLFFGILSLIVMRQIFRQGREVDKLERIHDDFH